MNWSKIHREHLWLLQALIRDRVFQTKSSWTSKNRNQRLHWASNSKHDLRKRFFQCCWCQHCSTVIVVNCRQAWCRESERKAWTVPVGQSLEHSDCLPGAFIVVTQMKPALSASVVWPATSTFSYCATSSEVLHPSIFSLSDANKGSSGKAVKC